MSCNFDKNNNNNNNNKQVWLTLLLHNTVWAISWILSKDISEMEGTQTMSGSRSWAELDGFKVHFTQRNHHPQAMPREDNIHGGVVMGGSAGFTSSIVVGEGSKRHFGHRYSTDEGRPEGKRYLAPPLPKDYENRGKKLISVLEYCDKEITLPTKKKFKESGMKNSASEVTLPSATWTRKRTVMVDEHTPAAMKQSDIFLLEASMNRKQRVANILAQRNMIPSASSGDLPFKQADREPGFYAKGGLIPGSTNVLRQSAKPTLRKSEELTNSSGKKLEATYGAMKARLEKDYDQRQVLSLTVGSERQGEAIPSWEAATGCFLVAPEDEAF